MSIPAITPLAAALRARSAPAEGRDLTVSILMQARLDGDLRVICEIEGFARTLLAVQAAIQRLAAEVREQADVEGWVL